MGSFCFFTDIDLLNNQTDAEAYGPVIGDEETMYRVTSMHTASSNPSAYAICNGVVMVQEDPDDTDLVNLILRPLQQPEFNNGYITYIIYKSILKSSLVDVTGELIADAETNDLTQSIWNAQAAINASVEEQTGTNPEDEPSSKTLGINYKNDETGDDQLLNSATIDSMFFRDSSNFQFPLVQGGWSIGTFSSEKFGLEILIEKLGFQPKFEIVRINDHILEVSELGGSPTQAEEFLYWNEKEAVLNYIDPCALYGSFYGYGLNAKSSIDLEFTQYLGNDIYINVLQKYFNKNRIYLDIRNSINTSFDFMGNYGRNIKLAFDELSTLNEFNYYNAGWPIMIFNAGTFPSGNSSNKNFLRILLPKKENQIPLVYLTNSIIDESFPKVIGLNKRYVQVRYLDEEDFLDTEIRLIIPNNNADETTIPICNLIIINYYDMSRLLSLEDLSGTVLQRTCGLDLIFPINNLDLNWVHLEGFIDIRVFNDNLFSEQFIESGNIMNIKFSMAIDINGDIYLMMMPTDKYISSTQKSDLSDLISSIHTNKFETLNKYLYSQNNCFWTMLKFQVGGEIKEALIVNYAGLNPSSQLSFIVPSTIEMVYQKFTSEDFANILDITSSTFLTNFPCYLAFEIVESGYDDTHTIPYNKYEIVLLGYKLSAAEDEIFAFAYHTENFIYRIISNTQGSTSNFFSFSNIVHNA